VWSGLNMPRPLVASALTTAALFAFAANSVLCRLALADSSIDAWAFTGLRIGAGALTLLLLAMRREGPRGGAGDWKRAGLLLLYALPFSLAYLELDTGTGALLLFGAVQVTMLLLGMRAGERPGAVEWVGLLGAFGGLVYLVSPGLSAPEPGAAAMMVAAGVGWGAYSVAGKGAGDPLGVTAGAFARAALLLAPVLVIVHLRMHGGLHADSRGAALALVSGALTSGVGYAIWYAALRHLTSTRAALVQLSVPVLAAAGGVTLLAEAITPRLAIAGAVILGSIAVGVLGRARS